MGAVKVCLLGKDIGRLADGTHHVVGFNGFIARQVLNLVVGLIESGADEIGKTGIDDGKLLDSTFFYI